jgi:methyltransferase (TIGR00027 family)
MAEDRGTRGDGVDLTAVAAAAGRAIETSRPDALVRDRYAQMLATSVNGTSFPVRWPDPAEPIPAMDTPMLLGSIWLGLRTRAIDDAVTGWAAESLADGTTGVSQVVVLGAGLDARAWRLPWPPGTQLYEVDRAVVLEHKQATLAGEDLPATVRRIPVGVDITADWPHALGKAGHDSRRPTVWIVEGLLPYLAASAARALLARIAASPAGSRVALELAVPIPDTPAARARLADMAAATGVPLADLLARVAGPDPVQVLAEAGWRVTVADVDELQIRYRRALREPRLMAALAMTGVTTDDGSAERGPSRAGLLFATRPAHA